MTKRSIAVALALFLAALAFPLTPSPAMANPSIQKWFLTDFTSGVSGADYIMYGVSENGSSNLLTIAKNGSKVWVADQPSNIVIDMSGTWTVDLWADSAPPGSSLTVDIGVLSSDGSTFTSKGTSASQTVDRNGGFLNFTMTTSSHIINPGEYLAVRVNAGSKAVDLDVYGDETDSYCFVTSPDVPDYPGMVFISLIVTDHNSDGIYFGSLDAGVTDQPADNDAAGAVILTVSGTTNVNCDILTRVLTNFEASSLANTTGTATGGSATSLVHSGASFLSTVTAGDIVTNTSDKSYAVVTTVTDNNNLVITALSDGGAFADTEGYSIASSTSITSGSATGGSTTSLINTGDTFQADDVQVGDIVTNDTDDTTSVVVAVVSQTELTLSGQADFSTGTPAYTVRRGDNAIAMGNAHWNTSNTTSGYTAMTTEYAIITTSTAHSETSQGVWYWLSIPGGQAAGTYDSTFYYQAVQQ